MKLPICLILLAVLQVVFVIVLLPLLVGMDTEGTPLVLSVNDQDPLSSGADIHPHFGAGSSPKIYCNNCSGAINPYFTQYEFTPKTQHSSSSYSSYGSSDNYFPYSSLSNQRSYKYNSYRQVNEKLRDGYQDYVCYSECTIIFPVLINRLDSLRTLLPYTHQDFDFCEKKSGPYDSPPENFGQVLFGDRIIVFRNLFAFNWNETCQAICEKTYNPKVKDDSKILSFLREGIRQNYLQHWIVDGIPVTWCRPGKHNQEICSDGFPLGCYISPSGQMSDYCSPLLPDRVQGADRYYLFNHLDLTVEYFPLTPKQLGEEHPGDFGHIVAVKVKPRSIANGFQDGNLTCGVNLSPLVIPGHGNTIVRFNYTISVTWKRNLMVDWPARWSYFLTIPSTEKYQMFNLANNCIIVLFFTLGVIWIFRNINKDIATSIKKDGDCKEVTADFGWQLIYRDVFRPPGCSMLLAALAGSGIHLLIVIFLTLALAGLGLLSIADSGAFTTCAFVLYIAFGSTSGYISARLYKGMRGENWKWSILVTTFLCPGMVFTLFTLLNTIQRICGSSAAVPVLTQLTILALVSGVSMPLNVLGACFGFKKRAFQHLADISSIQRMIPHLPWYKRSLPICMLSGAGPFACLFIHLYFVMNSIWLHQVYTSYGCLFLATILQIIMSAELAIILCNAQLRSEDYNWWWRCFVAGGFCSVYFFGYSVYYLIAKMELSGFTSIFLYLGYSAMMAFLMFIVTGSVGFLSSLWFVLRIYNHCEESRTSGYDDKVVAADNPCGQCGQSCDQLRPYFKKLEPAWKICKLIFQRFIQPYLIHFLLFALGISSIVFLSTAAVYGYRH